MLLYFSHLSYYHREKVQCSWIGSYCCAADSSSHEPHHSPMFVEEEEPNKNKAIGYALQNS